METMYRRTPRKRLHWEINWNLTPIIPLNMKVFGDATLTTVAEILDASAMAATTSAGLSVLTMSVILILCAFS